MNNSDINEIENLINKTRKRYIKETLESLSEEIEKNRCILTEQEQQEIDSVHKLTDEENNALIQHLLEEGKKRNIVKLAKPIQVENEQNKTL